MITDSIDDKTPTILIGQLVSHLLEHPQVQGAAHLAMSLRDNALSAQETALSVLNLPTATELDRIGQRVRAISQRLELLEDRLEQVADMVAGLTAGVERLGARLAVAGSER